MIMKLTYFTKLTMGKTQMFKSILLTVALFILTASCVCSSATEQILTPAHVNTPSSSISKDEDHDAYLAVDFSQFADFFEHYESALSDNESWLRDPMEVALRFEAWPPSEPGCHQKEITAIPAESGKAIIIIIRRGCPDDSIIDIKMRVELSEAADIWAVEWAGTMWKCSRGDDQQLKDDWHSGACP